MEQKNKMKIYKGEKYIYLLMAFKLAKQSKNNYVRIGLDNNFTGGNNYVREFRITDYKGKILLTEIKTSKSFADFSRTFEVLNCDSDKPSIMDYINEDFENCGNNWTH